MNKLVKFLKDEDGATAIEYALIAGLIAIAIIGAVTLLGTDLNKVFKKSSTELNKVAP